MSYNDQYRPSGFSFMPQVTKNIIIINVIVFALTFLLKQTQGVDLYKHLGLHHHSAPDFRPHQFVTYLFMHGNMSHIFFNMFGVFIFGQVLENLWGPKRFLIFYILTGLGAALTQYFIIQFSVADFVNAISYIQDNLSPENLQKFINSGEFGSAMSSENAFLFEQFKIKYNSAIESNPAKAMSLASDFLIDYKNNYLNANVVVGASGSLFGLLGAFGMLFPNRYLYLYFLFPVKAKWLVIAYGAIELFSGLNQNPQDNVAHFAHLGGLAVGVILVLLWRKDRRNFY